MPSCVSGRNATRASSRAAASRRCLAALLAARDRLDVELRDAADEERQLKNEIENAGGLSFRNVSLSRSAFGTVLFVGNEEIILAGVRPDQVTASDFVFLR
jgi:hypothetical protein